MDSLRIIRLWAAVAWADRVLHPSEAAALKRLIDATSDLTKVEREEAMSYLSSAPLVDISEAQNLSEEAREGVYRAALGIVILDREFVEAEKAFLARLRSTLHLDLSTIARLESEARSK